ncbi:MAG TPA: methyltransferase domain-containing protein, partial [Polyangiaceae bacterium]|nr:methyltransferase domain-containing protein [Polyangiaceae bacterium]
FVSEAERVVEILVFFGEECLHRERAGARLPSPDLTSLPPPHDWRFSISCLTKDVGRRVGGSLRFVLERGTTISLPLPVTGAGKLSEPSSGQARFRRLLVEEGRKHVLDIGSRARSGISRKQETESLASGIHYFGVDVLPGENVDCVVDAHELSETLGRSRFDAVMSHVAFEHLAMPWKVVIEMNHVLRPSGIAYIQSVQTCGMHDLPWDFFRFSDSAYRALFNRGTGFEVLETSLSSPVHVFPFVHHAPFWDNAELAAGFFNAEVVVRKIADTQLSWPVALSDVVDAPYPA